MNELPGQNKETEARVRQAANSYTTRIDAFLNRTANYPSLKEDIEELFYLQLERAGFKTDAIARLAHDLLPILTYPLPNGRGMPIERIPRRELELCARSRERIVGSMLADFGVSLTPVDIAGIVQDDIDFCNLKNEAARYTGRRVDPTTVITSLESGRWVVSSQEDALFRIILNARRNSGKAIEAVHPEWQTGGKIGFEARTEDGRTVLDIIDNGCGFGRLFGRINYRPIEDEIPLRSIIQQSKGISGFERDGLEGTGHGLGIMQHFGDLLGITITVRNPKLADESRVSLIFG